MSCFCVPHGDIIIALAHHTKRLYHTQTIHCLNMTYISLASKFVCLWFTKHVHKVKDARHIDFIYLLLISHLIAPLICYDTCRMMCGVCGKDAKIHTNDKTQTEASHWIRLRSQMIRGQFHKRTNVLRISRRHCGVEVVVGQWNGNRASIELTVIAADGCVYVCASRRCSKWMNISLSLFFVSIVCCVQYRPCTR